MRTDTRAGSDAAVLKGLNMAFDAAWDTLKDLTSEADRDSVRDVVGQAIMGLARHGYTNAGHLATLAAYRGRAFIDLRC
jgi:hypothetical protein